jgi:hypothetical protein
MPTAVARFSLASSGFRPTERSMARQFEAKRGMRLLSTR